MNAGIIWVVSVGVICLCHLVQSSHDLDKFRTFLLDIEDITELNQNLKKDVHRLNETNKQCQALMQDINQTNNALQAENKELKEQITEMNQTISSLQIRLAGEVL